MFRAFINRQLLVLFLNLFTAIHDFFSRYIRVNPTDKTDTQSSSPPPPPPMEAPPFDPLQPSVPVSYPIKTLNELKSRTYFDSFHYPFNRSSVPLRPDAVKMPNRPRILVCHDMAGGYTDDKWIQGGSNPDAYAIWHWYLMDVFVYFSHNLVALPPPCWTNTAHSHGVKVLGTFIMEWEEGAKAANELLSSKESARMYAERLTELAVALGFDGWLINMEVNLAVEKVPTMELFVSHLTQTMHSSIPGSLVIWYDSVTIEGDLIWQNQLNEYNKPFFDRCDGLFVNYTWREDYPKRSAAVAGDRKFDVYMGIDVFGRGTFGGGQWNTNFALDVIKKNDVSAAIFAPGWVYETKQPPDFQTAQNRWWSLVEKSWGIVQKYPKVLPFYSNFDQGHGYHFSVDGKQLSDARWNNISLQSFQPFLEFLDDPAKSKIQAIVDFKEASYSGGGSITFKGTIVEDSYSIIRLFVGELPCGSTPLWFTHSVRSNGNSLLGICLEFTSDTETKTLLVASGGDTLLTMNRFSSMFDTVIMPLKVTNLDESAGWLLHEAMITMSGYTLTKINAVCYKLRHKVSDLRTESNLTGQVDILVSPSHDFHAVLGHTSIRNVENQNPFPPASSWTVDGQYIKWSSDQQNSKLLSFKLSWKLRDGSAPVFPMFNIYVEELSKAPKDVHKFLGVARVEAFYVSDLEVPSGTSDLKFVIQLCGVDGSFQPLKESPSFQLRVEGP